MELFDIVEKFDPKPIITCGTASLPMWHHQSSFSEYISPSDS